MSSDLVLAGLICWIAAAILALCRRAGAARLLLGLGGVAVAAVSVMLLPAGSAIIHLPLGIGPLGSDYYLGPDALWLLGFGLPAAVLACWLGSPTRRGSGWTFGAAVSLIGALGVFGFQDALTFLISWEVMSLGGALMLLGENLASEKGRPVLFMLALLEAGSVALILAMLLLSDAAGSVSFSGFAAAANGMGTAEQFFVGLLLLIGFGAKLGLLPFYEWFPGAYGSGSGASGAIMSGFVLNAAFFALSRAFLSWMPINPDWSVSAPGIFIVTVAVLSAILTALYAFQQEGWRELLSLSSAENGSIAVCLLGAALMFRQDGLGDLAGLAWLVALLHLGGHALAKGAMFLSADAAYRVNGDYLLVQRGILVRSSWIFGLGALFASMSLAAMPPQAGFVSEWYLFQTLFQGFHLGSLASRLTAALAGAGLAVTAAIAFATFVKVLGLGLLGRASPSQKRVPAGNAAAVGLLGLLVLVLAVGMPLWLTALTSVGALGIGSNAATLMHDHWILVPLTAKFAFISPSKLIIAMPLLAVIPILLSLTVLRRGRRRVEVWYGGREHAHGRAATTALAFSNALRTFYSFIYRPTAQTQRFSAPGPNGHHYFVRRLSFNHDVAPIFGPLLFRPLERLILAAARRIRVIQSGHLNLYLSLIGALLIVILIIALF